MLKKLPWHYGIQIYQKKGQIREIAILATTSTQQLNNNSSDQDRNALSFVCVFNLIDGTKKEKKLDSVFLIGR